MIRLSILAALLLACSAAWSAPRHAAWPGGVGVVNLGGGERPKVSLDDKPVLVMREADDWLAVVGIPLDIDGSRPLVLLVQKPDGTSAPHSISIGNVAYREQRLTVERKYVEPDPESLERIFAERKVIDRALTHWEPRDVRSIRLQAPVPGKRSTSFGSRRIFNDQPRSPHKGMDIAASSGTPIVAPLAATVSVTGDFYFNGNTVILDHGQGLVTLYCHLSSIDATEGQDISAGQLLGKVGATGRVTGPHLHFATYLNGTAINPALLLEAAAP